MMMQRIQNPAFATPVPGGRPLLASRSSCARCGDSVEFARSLKGRRMPAASPKRFPRAGTGAVRCSSAQPGVEGLSYASSGVDINLEGASVAALIRGLGKNAAPRKSGELGAQVDHAGGFSGLVEFGDRLLAMCTDGVGSKLMLCAETGFYDSVALDCMAMNVNDLLCIGAEPLAFVDYIAAPKPSPEIWEALGRSLGEACKLANVTLCGGETATLPDMVNEIDMSGTALGWLPKGSQLDGRSIVTGDTIIGLPSSGIHSNGLSLARKVLAKSGLSLADPAPFAITDGNATRAGQDVWRHREKTTSPVTMAEVLMNPTRIYVDPLVDLLRQARENGNPCQYAALHGIVHVTGGGLSNLLRLHPRAGYTISSPLPVLPEFEWMQRAGDVSDFEMYRTFNMGMGMAVIVESSAAPAVASWLSDRLPGSQIVGHVDETGTVVHEPSGTVFGEY